MRVTIIALLFVLFATSCQAFIVVTSAPPSSGGTTCISETLAIGNDTSEPTSVSANATQMFANKFTALCSGNIDEITFDTQYLNVGEYATVGIYEDSSGYPGALLVDSVEYEGTDNNRGFVTVALDSAYAQEENRIYWLIVHFGSGGRLFYKVGTTDQSVTVANTYVSGTLPATFPSGGTVYDREYGVYANAE